MPIIEGKATLRPKRVPGGYSDERIRHFRCNSCNGWWSIGEPPDRDPDQELWHCPWCGEQQFMKPLEA